MLKICGFQKLTLLDFPGHVACTIFLGGCQLRCPFCHNASLVLHPGECEEITKESVLEYLKKRTGILEGVAVTGGEPLLHPETREFIREIKELGYRVKLDTNGFYPEYLQSLVEEQLVDYVAVDIKNSKEKYPETVGRNDLEMENIEKTVSYLLKKPIPYEFRTTCVAEFHTPEEMKKIGEWIQGCENYFLQQFVDNEQLISSGMHALDAKGMKNLLDAVKEYVPSAEIRGVR